MSGSKVLGTGTMSYGYSTRTGPILPLQPPPSRGRSSPRTASTRSLPVYAGDANYLSSTSSGPRHHRQRRLLRPRLDSAVQRPPVASPGSSASATMTVTPFGGFTGTVNLTCSIPAPLPPVSTPTCDAASRNHRWHRFHRRRLLTCTLTGTTTPGNYAVIVTAADAAATVNATADIALAVKRGHYSQLHMTATPVAHHSARSGRHLDRNRYASGGFQARSRSPVPVSPV